VLAEITGALGTTGWPFGLMLAVAAGTERLQTRRRRLVLNRALHEVRRPLQALVLAGAPERRVREAVEMTVAALGDLDREINHEPPQFRPQRVRLDELAEAAAERWRATANRLGRPLALRLHTHDAELWADRAQVSRAVENLIANALEHGSGFVEIAATVGGGKGRIAIADGGSSPPRRTLRWLLRGRDSRRGHGHAIVSEVARRHSGRFFWLRSERGSIAVLELPVFGRQGA
jgi:signal transduction histidine kinase